MQSVVELLKCLGIQSGCITTFSFQNCLNSLQHASYSLNHLLLWHLHHYLYCLLKCIKGLLLGSPSSQARPIEAQSGWGQESLGDVWDCKCPGTFKPCLQPCWYVLVGVKSVETPTLGTQNVSIQWIILPWWSIGSSCGLVHYMGQHVE